MDILYADIFGVGDFNLGQQYVPETWGVRKPF